MEASEAKKGKLAFNDFHVFGDGHFWLGIF
jgi:hypothetical protein